MASISGLNGTSMSGMNGLQGYGGLASGLDRDTLIKDMTYGTTSRIEKQKQQKMLLEWKQTAMRNIADMMIDFANKYTATMTSSTNLFSNTFWAKANATAMGANKDLVSIAGKLSAAKDLSIQGVKQLAQKAQWTSERVENKEISTGEIDLAQQFQTTSDLAEKTLNIKYDGKDYAVTLEKGDYSDAGKTVAAIEAALEKVEVKNEDGTTQTLKDVLKVGLDSGDATKITFGQNVQDGKELKITGGTALAGLGFEKAPEADLSKETVTGASTKVGIEDWIAGKQMTFMYNGKAATVKMPGKEAFENKDTLTVIKDSIQEQLDAAYGKGRVKVDTAAGDNGGQKLTFKTTTPDGSDDQTSTLNIVSGDSRLVGADGVLGVTAGESNRVNMNGKVNLLAAGVTEGKFEINGEEITITNNDTYASLINKINNSKAGVQVSYQEASGQFTFLSKEEGAGGKIEFGGDLAGKVQDAFHLVDDEKYNKKGQDAIVTVKYGNGDEFNVVRSSNTFDLDGVTLTVKGTFGEYDNQNKLTKADAVTFDVQSDTDTIVKGIKDMVDQYNAILELVNKELTTRPDREYKPLTSDQKKELSDDEAKTYEEKAKEGLLFGDSDLRSLSGDLRFIINPADLAEYEKIGITVSSSYTDNGKLVIDEEKLKAALAEDPQKVQDVFTKTKATDPNGRDGIAQNLTNVMDKYVKTIGQTKGILIEKAGSTKAPASVTKNAYYRELQSIQEKIADLERRLKSEQDRYIKQFTSLETVISQMNAQSGWLSQFGGY